MLLLVLMTTFPANAEQSQSVNSSIKVDQNFNHQNTRFPLSGMHVKVTCETCHKGGIFKGTPVACIGCHNTSLAKGKPLNHPKTSDQCVDCHNSFDFSQVHVDHSKISKGCISCHNNKTAEGKNKNHIKSNNNCEDCHLTSTWRIAHFDHETTHEPCQTCHDNIRATGKPFTHIRSTNDCAQCHRTVSWKVGVFDHTGIVDGCAKCHDGISATGKSSNHLNTSNACQNCHTTVAWSPAKFDHKDQSVQGAACVDCHDGRRATGRSNAHFATNTNDCALCHTTVAWKPANWDHQFALDLSSCVSCHTGQHLPALGKINAPNPHVPSNNDCTACHSATNFVTWAGAKMDHSAIFTGCVNCHNGTFLAAGKPVVAKNQTHIASTDSCESCHLALKGVSFKPAMLPLDHSQVKGACISCHNGKQSISTGPIVGKLQGLKATHLPTSDSCDFCHTTVQFIPATKFDHTQATNVANCVSCHNGVLATGMLTGPSKFHVPVLGGGQCTDCHTNFVAWVPAVFDHSKVTTVCLTCHNGTMAISKGKLTTKHQTHIATNLGCENCHTTTTWKTSLFNHSQIGATTCVTCHDGVQATGKINAAIKHIPTDNNCISCHTTIAWSPIAFDAAKHALVSPVCTDCHNGTQAITKGKLTAKPVPHLTIPASQNCSDCHTSFTTWVTTFTHNAATMGAKTCVQCHDSVQAKGKKNALVPHIPTSDTCNDCHKNFLTFNPVVFDAALHGLVSSTCADCHNGTAAISTGKLVMKPTPHIPTTANCANCHTSFTTWVTKFDHATRGAATCFSCHDGKLATGKPNNHVPASTTCDNCHSKTSFVAWLPVTLPFNHADPGVVGVACEKCHDGVLATGRDKAHILTSTAACASCHTSNVSWTPLNPSFHNFTVGTCFSCHDGAHATITKPITGKDAPHMKTTDVCESCHVANITGWTPAKMPFDHTQTTAACFACHDGAHKLAAGGPVVGKITGHVPTSNDCASCHTNVTSFKTWTMRHDDPVVYAATCVSCHDGQFSAVGVVARSKAATNPKAPTGHQTAAYNSCANCHTTISFVPAHFDHTAVLAGGTPCATCHDTGKPNAVVRPINHIAIIGGQPDCAQCHTTATWVTNAKPDHSTFTSATNCFSCHQPAPAGNAMPKSPSHYATDNACGFCHNTTSFKPANKFDHAHATSVTPCVTCHDGAPAHAPALGKASFPAHLTTSNTCENCHTGFISWVTTKFDHTDSVVKLATCVSCHDGAHSPAIARSPAHLASTTLCVNCHNTTNVGFKPAIAYDHTQFLGTCLSCHDGSKSISTGAVVARSATHFSTTALCQACHNTTKFTPAVAFDHTQTSATCLSCHDGSKTTVFKGLVLPKTPTHILSTNNCVNCHNTVAFKPGLQPRQTDHTQVIGTCFSCHNGARAISTGPIVGQLQGPTASHLPTGTVCETCHTTTSFIPALAFDHTGVAAGTCINCHNNVKAIGKPVSPVPHMATDNACDNCHKNFKAWKPVPAAQFQHADTLGTCYSCHGGSLTISTGKVTAKSTTHIASSTSCDTCHKSTVNWNVTPVQVDHTQVTGACISCHSGTAKLSLTGTLISFKSNTHLTTTNSCQACHANGGKPWTPAIAFDHTQALGTCVSCHDGAHKTTVMTVTGKDPAHLTTTNSCESCHVSGVVFNDWKVTPVTKFDHGQALGTCAACHDGVKKMGISGTLLDRKSATHFITTKDCALCHNTIAWNPMLNYVHTSPAYVAHTPVTTVPAGVAGCPVCHKQNNEKITFLQPGLFPNCATCHADKFKPSAHLKYSAPVTTFYTFSDLKDCTGACHVYADQTLSKITQSKPTFSHHRPTFSWWN